jgi:hypothetical protein
MLRSSFESEAYNFVLETCIEQMFFNCLDFLFNFSTSIKNLNLETGQNTPVINRKKDKFFREFNFKILIFDMSSFLAIDLHLARPVTYSKYFFFFLTFYYLNCFMIRKQKIVTKKFYGNVLISSKNNYCF